MRNLIKRTTGEKKKKGAIAVEYKAAKIFI